MGLCGYNREPPVMNEDQVTILAEMEKIAKTMDKTLFSVCGIGICLDGLIGFIPGIGDFSTALVSLWMLMRCCFAFDKWLWRRKGCTMLFNVALDLSVGLIPVIGDIFDVGWKSNVKNVNIVRDFYGMEPTKVLDDPEEEDEDHKRSWGLRRRKKASRSIPAGDAPVAKDGANDS